MANILFIGDLNKYGRSYRRLKTLERFNHVIISYSHSIISSNNKIKPPSLLYRLFNKIMLPFDVTEINKNIKLSIINQKVDIVWIENGITIYPSTLKFLKKQNSKIKIVSLSEDDMCKKHNQSLWYLFGLKYYDIVFTTKKHNLDCLLKLGAKKVLIFYDSFDSSLHKIYKNINIKRYEYLVTHIGAYEKERSEYLYFLAENGIKVDIWGNNWNECKYRHANLKIHHKFLYGKKYPILIYKSKINLNFLRKINDDVITSRTLEIPASGGFMLAERTETQKKLFKEKVEADYFSTKDELLKKIKFYLKNEIKRKTIESNGYNKCVNSKFNMVSQMNMILKNIFQIGK